MILNGKAIFELRKIEHKYYFNRNALVEIVQRIFMTAGTMKITPQLIKMVQEATSSTNSSQLPPDEIKELFLKTHDKVLILDKSGKFRKYVEYPGQDVYMLSSLALGHEPIEPVIAVCGTVKYITTSGKIVKTAMIRIPKYSSINDLPNNAMQAFNNVNGLVDDIESMNEAMAEFNDEMFGGGGIERITFGKMSMSSNLSANQKKKAYQKWTNSHKHTPFDDEVCPLCEKDAADIDDIVVFECKDTFHMDCYAKYRERSGISAKCPCCSDSITIMFNGTWKRVMPKEKKSIPHLVQVDADTFAASMGISVEELQNKIDAEKAKEKEKVEKAKLEKIRMQREKEKKEAERKKQEKEVLAKFNAQMKKKK
jgi:hypothetical protein